MSFIAFAEGVIEHVDDTYGRSAAWLVGILLAVLPIALLLGAISWIIG